MDNFIFKVYYLSFAIVLAQTVAGGVLAVAAKNLIHCFLGMVVALIGVAGLYYHLGSPFIALMQVMIYVGAVCVAIAFGLSLTRKAGEEGLKPLSPMAVVPVVLPAGMLAATLKGLSHLEKTGMPRKLDESIIGWQLLGNYLFPFEIISVLLTLAVIGALSVALIRRREKNGNI